MLSKCLFHTFKMSSVNEKEASAEPSSNVQGDNEQETNDPLPLVVNNAVNVFCVVPITTVHVSMMARIGSQRRRGLYYTRISGHICRPHTARSRGDTLISLVASVCMRVCVSVCL